MLRLRFSCILVLAVCLHKGECQTGGGGNKPNMMEIAKAFMNTPMNSGASMPAGGSGKSNTPTFGTEIAKMITEMTQAFGGQRGAGGMGGANPMQGMMGMSGFGDAPDAGNFGGMMSGGGMANFMQNFMGGSGGGMGRMMQGMIGGGGMGSMGRMMGGMGRMMGGMDGMMGGFDGISGGIDGMSGGIDGMSGGMGNIDGMSGGMGM